MSSLRILLKQPSIIVWDFSALHNYSLETDKNVRDKSYADCLCSNFQRHTGRVVSYDGVMSLVNKSSDVKAWYKLFKTESALFMSVLDGYDGLGLEKQTIQKLNDDWVLLKEARVKRAESIRRIAESATKQVSIANEEFRAFSTRVDARCLVNMVREDHIPFERELELSEIMDPEARELAVKKEIVEIKKRVLLEHSPGYAGEILYPISLLLF